MYVYIYIYIYISSGRRAPLRCVCAGARRARSRCAASQHSRARCRHFRLSASGCLRCSAFCRRAPLLCTPAAALEVALERSTFASVPYSQQSVRSGRADGRFRTVGRGDEMVGIPHRAQIYTFELFELSIEIGQTALCRAMRGNGISVSSSLPPSYTLNTLNAPPAHPRPLVLSLPRENWSARPQLAPRLGVHIARRWSS